MTEQITTREATPSFIEGVVVASNSDQSKTVDLSTGVIRLQYWESILQDGIRAKLFSLKHLNVLRLHNYAICYTLEIINFLSLLLLEQLRLDFYSSRWNFIPLQEKQVFKFHPKALLYNHYQTLHNYNFNPCNF